jgi:hypothetical protein
MYLSNSPISYYHTCLNQLDLSGERSMNPHLIFFVAAI